MPGHGSARGLLGSSNNGTGTGDLTVTYTDGSTKTQPISFADWYSNAPAPGDGMVAPTLHWNTSSGPGTQPVSIYSTSVPLDAAKTVQSITLPDITPATSANGQLETHIFAAAIADGSVTVPFSSLQAAYNNVGIADSANPAQANFDGGGYSFSQQALTAAELALGATVNQDGATLTWPNVAAGQPDNVVSQGQTIDLTGSGTSLVAGSANNGTVSGTGTINYSDGSTQAFTLTLADWYADAPAAGDQLVAHHAGLEHPTREHPGQPRGERVFGSGPAHTGQDRPVGHTARDQPRRR